MLSSRSRKKAVIFRIFKTYLLLFELLESKRVKGKINTSLKPGTVSINGPTKKSPKSEFCPNMTLGFIV